jgi:NAD(P) transhydrogenase subunit alpha
MLIGIPKETVVGETRVAITPEVVKKWRNANVEVVVASGAGLSSSFTDEAYVAAGAKIGSQAEAFAAEIVLKVRSPNTEELAQMNKGALLIGMLNPYDTANYERIANSGLTAFCLEKMPRITRAQSMDILSSQANIAGYKSVLLAANSYGRFFPMLMTAAGTVKAARVLVLGVGVAGLQAIATAKRLGAVIEASDVRPSVKDQVTSLGAKWVDVPYETDEERECAEGVGGYARPMPPSWLERQGKIVHERAKQMDIVITTALIPGRPAPKLIKADTVAEMKSGSVIVDLAAEQGGNVEGCVTDKIVTTENGVTIIGLTNLATHVAADASALYARNLYNFLSLMLDPKSGEFKVPEEDEIVVATLVKKP